MSKKTSKARPKKRKAFPFRDCPVCGEVIARKAGETPYKYATRLTCSAACRDRKRQLERDERIAEYIREHNPRCGICNAPLVPKPTETTQQFTRRKHCSHGCASQRYQRQGRDHYRAPANRSLASDAVIAALVPTRWEPIIMRPDFTEPAQPPARPGITGIDPALRASLAAALKLHDPDFLEAWRLAEEGAVDTSFALDAPVRALSLSTTP